MNPEDFVSQEEYGHDLHKIDRDLAILHDQIKLILNHFGGIPESPNFDGLEGSLMDYERSIKD